LLRATCLLVGLAFFPWQKNARLLNYYNFYMMILVFALGFEKSNLLRVSQDLKENVHIFHSTL